MIGWWAWVPKVCWDAVAEMKITALRRSKVCAAGGRKMEGDEVVGGGHAVLRLRVWQGQTEGVAKIKWQVWKAAARQGT